MRNSISRSVNNTFKCVCILTSLKLCAECFELLSLDSFSISTLVIFFSKFSELAAMIQTKAFLFCTNYCFLITNKLLLFEAEYFGVPKVSRSAM